MAVLQIEKEELPEEDGWKMYFDGASNALGHDVGAVLISPERNHCPFTAKLSFDFPDDDLMAVLQIEKEESPKENG